MKAKFIYDSYQKGLEKAQELGLKLSEYGVNYNDTCTFYSCWNETGNNGEKPIVYAEYSYNRKGPII